MTVVPLVPLADRIEQTRQSERRRCLMIVEDINAAGGHCLTARAALAMVHAAIGREDQPDARKLA